MSIFTTLRRLFGFDRAAELAQRQQAEHEKLERLRQLSQETDAMVEEERSRILMGRTRLAYDTALVRSTVGKGRAPAPEVAAARQRSNSDDGFDGAGLAIGLMTGVPIGPRGVTGEALIGATMHSSPAASFDSSPSCSSGSSFDTGSSSCTTSSGGID